VRNLPADDYRARRAAAGGTELISGHSLGAGYAISATARSMPAYRIQSHTRYTSAEWASASYAKVWRDCASFR
jgi:hypothetical protein